MKRWGAIKDNLKDGKIEMDCGFVCLVGARAEIHDSAYIGAGCYIGVGCTIRAGCKIVAGCNIGAYCEIGADCYIGAGCDIGAYCYIGAGCEIGASCKIGTGCTIGAGCIGDRHLVLGLNLFIGAKQNAVSFALTKDGDLWHHIGRWTGVGPKGVSEAKKIIRYKYAAGSRERAEYAALWAFVRARFGDKCRHKI